VPKPGNHSTYGFEAKTAKPSRQHSHYAKPPMSMRVLHVLNLVVHQVLAMPCLDLVHLRLRLCSYYLYHCSITCPIIHSPSSTSVSTLHRSRSIVNRLLLDLLHCHRPPHAQHLHIHKPRDTLHTTHTMVSHTHLSKALITSLTFTHHSHICIYQPRIRNCVQRCY
jgi:hypothetical protein